MEALLRVAVLALPSLFLLACGGASHTPDAAPPDAGGPVCEGDGWQVMDWVVDGESGRTPCMPAYGVGAVSGGHTDGAEPLAYWIGPALTSESDPAFLARPPLCEVGLAIYNIELPDGARGDELAAARPHDARPAFIVLGEIVHGGAELCLVQVPPDGAREGWPATAGTWRVLQGGSWGDVVDIEAEGLTFDPVDGHTIEVPYARWRVALPVEPIRYP